jgi:hypothetical protein
MTEQRPSKDLAGELKQRAPAVEDGGYVCAADAMVRASAEIERLQRENETLRASAEEWMDKYIMCESERAAQPPRDGQ